MATDGQRLVGNLKRAATVMAANMSPGKWPGWVIYLLKALQDEPDDERYEEFLRNLKGAIEARLEDGRW